MSSSLFFIITFGSSLACFVFLLIRDSKLLISAKSEVTSSLSWLLSADSTSSLDQNQDLVLTFVYRLHLLQNHVNLRIN